MSVLREIGIIARALDSIANIEFRDIELARGQYLYLVRIAENPGIIQEELSELLKVDRSTIARSVKKLEAKGLVQQKAAKGNKKNKEWFVTEKGEKLYPLILAENDYSEETSLQGFSQAEVQALEKMLIRVREKRTKKKLLRLKRCIMKVTVEHEFWQVFPEGQISVLVVKGLDNSVDESKDPYFKSLLDKGAKRAEDFILDENFTQNEVIQEWRQAFSQFKTKKGARSSIEALLKRVSQGREFHPINPLVDIYNSVSLSYAVPCGGEDLDKIVGGLHLGKAKGGESFFPLGAESDAPALPEEIIYYDEEGAVCRCLNWREAQRTMLTEETKNAILVIEAINEEQAVRAQAAMIELQTLIEDYSGVKGEITHLTLDNPSLEI